MKSLFTFLTLTFFTLSSFAQIEALFHPYDDTLGKISEIFLNAEESIDMALYNIGTQKGNPVYKTLASKPIQDRIKSGDLKVRIIFEGYATKEENFEKMRKLEALGVDAKYLGIGKKMHHKFSIVDFSSNHQWLITGSANWSLSSQRNYNENTLFIKNKPALTTRFQNEFDLLWSQAKEYGNVNTDEEPIFHTFPVPQENNEGLEVMFNSDNFDVTARGFRKSKHTTYVLTREIVQAINEADDLIEIATTRIKLRPIYEALLAAAARGVKIKLIVTMGEFKPNFLRKKTKIKPCSNAYNKKCSTSQNFAIFLTDLDYPGKENVEVRAKFFDMRHDQYLQKQMHSKYILVDNTYLLTGSFNWSYSAEYNHFENLVELSSDKHQKVIDSFRNDFDQLWGLNRALLSEKIQTLNSKKKIKCSFQPMSLSFKEIDSLLNAARKSHRRVNYSCY